MSNEYYISTAYLKLVLQSSAETSNIALNSISSNIDEVLKADYVSGDVVNKMYEAFAVHGVESWITHYGGQLGVGSHGPLSFAALSAPTLGAALQTLSDFMVIRTSGFATELRENDQQLELVLHDRSNHPLAGRWLIESGFLVVQNLIEAITGHPPGDNAELLFTYEQPSNHRELSALFKLPCRYRAKNNCLSIPLSWAGIPSPLSDADTFHSNIAKCRELKLQLTANKKDVHHLVNARLLAHFERRLSNNAKSEKIPSITTLAKELFMSPRSLIRKLDNQGSSYKEILQSVMLEQAQYLLKETHYTSAEIAGKLGYQDAANFGRAFKRWSGQTPSNWRRNP